MENNFARWKGQDFSLTVRRYRGKIMADNIDKGIVDATNRIMRELIKKPVLKSSIRSVLNSIDPESAPDLVRTLMWDDAELILSLVGALPSIANVFIKALEEVAVQVNKFPPDLLQEFTRSILKDIDIEAMNRAVQDLSKILDDLAPIFAEAFPGGDKEGGEA